LHVVVDNYATHKHQRIQAWLEAHPRIQLHFTPTYASWLNLVEVFFAIIERQALCRDDFTSVQELIAAIARFCDGWNQRCQPFRWTKDADLILTNRTPQSPTATRGLVGLLGGPLVWLRRVASHRSDPLPASASRPHIGRGSAILPLGPAAEALRR
jgi:hypothetical protein